MATVVQEALTGIRVVKAFGGQALERAKFQDPPPTPGNTARPRRRCP